MDFFEVLTEKTLEREQDRVGSSVYLSAGVQRGIEATIEALKEMMVGQIVPMHLEYFGDGMLLRDQNGEPHGSYPFRFGCTDGEEVVRMVFRAKKEDNK